MKRIEYTRHARNRMRWRNIDKQIVEKVLASPDRVEASGERINAYGNIDGIDYKVCYVIESETVVVITALEVGLE